MHYPKVNLSQEQSIHMFCDDKMRMRIEPFFDFKLREERKLHDHEVYSPHRLLDFNLPDRTYLNLTITSDMAKSFCGYVYMATPERFLEALSKVVDLDFILTDIKGREIKLLEEKKTWTYEGIGHQYFLDIPPPLLSLEPNYRFEYKAVLIRKLVERR